MTGLWSGSVLFELSACCLSCQFIVWTFNVIFGLGVCCLVFQSVVGFVSLFLFVWRLFGRTVYCLVCNSLVHSACCLDCQSVVINIVYFFAIEKYKEISLHYGLYWAWHSFQPGLFLIFWFIIAEGGITGRGCSTKDKVYYKECETNRYGEGTEKFCYSNFYHCNGGAWCLLTVISMAMGYIW